MQELPKKVLAALINRDTHYTDPREFKKILVQATFLPIALSLFLSVLFIHQVYNILEENQKVRHSDEVLNLAGESLKLVLDSETGFRGYVITTNTEYLEPWENARNKFNQTSEQLLKMVNDNPDQGTQILKIKNLYDAWNTKAVETLQYREKFNRDSPDELKKLRKKLMDSIRLNFDEFIAAERALRDSRWKTSEETSKQAIYIIIGLGLFLGMTLATMSLLQLRKLSKNYTTAYSLLSEATDHLEETVALRTHELTLANKELEAFSYSVSHDLRAPLRGIDGFSQILVEDYSDKLDGEAVRYLGFIRSGVQKMGVLIDDLINLSRLTRAEFNKQEIDLATLGGDIMRELQAQNPERKFEFINFNSHKVLADAGLLRAALQNLMENAWKYSRNKDVTFIELGQINKDGLVAFYVKDNGVGFDMRFYDKLFQPFQRLHNKDQFDGSGIGLATVARIIRRHNGTLWAESEIGSGSTFYFTLGA